MTGNAVASTVRVQRSVSLQCPKLMEINYTSWSILVETMLRAHCLWKTVLGEDEDEKQNYTTKAIIYPTLPEDVLLQVTEYKDAQDVLDSIKIWYLGIEVMKKGRLQTLRGELEWLKMKDNKRINVFSGKIIGMVKVVDTEEVMEGTMKEVEEAEEEEKFEVTKVEFSVMIVEIWALSYECTKC
uniref:DUF4219 domain-containing protein n=1 Tax=Lactuca sativa TaxID=4236 RepID=A0A9R1VJ59_LACSA|nr:hypothetical protein LSAT_V11C500258090 [Lactuca sativa]